MKVTMPQILVIDSDEPYRQYLVALLTRAGYLVDAPSGDAAMRGALQAGRFSAVLTELYMPDIDGIEVVRVVKGRFPTVPVIGLTGGALGPLDPCGKAMLAFGAETVLTKPIDAELFLTALRRALDSMVCRSPCEPLWDTPIHHPSDARKD
jgi:CheY-like chemotaxis protein